MRCRWPRRARSPLGRRPLRGGRCDHHDQFNRSRVVRDRQRAGFGACGASDSPRLAIVAGGARADQYRWRSPRTDRGPSQPCSPAPAGGADGPEASGAPAFVCRLRRSWAGKDRPGQTRPGIRASCERRRSNTHPCSRMRRSDPCARGRGSGHRPDRQIHPPRSSRGILPGVRVTLPAARVTLGRASRGVRVTFAGYSRWARVTFEGDVDARANRLDGGLRPPNSPGASQLTREHGQKCPQPGTFGLATQSRAEPT
jgi:hypothetical protein